MKKRKKMLTILLAAAMVGSAILTGCSSGEETQSNDAETVKDTAAAEDTATAEDAEDTDDAETAAQEEEETVEISMMTLWAEDNQENIATSVREALEKFQEEHPNIIVNVESIGDQTAYYTKIKTLAASNQPSLMYSFVKALSCQPLPRTTW